MSLESILVVDDSEADHFLMECLLEDLGINIQMNKATDGLEALSFLDNTEYAPDAILVDINMPRMDGMEFLEILRKKNASQSSSLDSAIFVMTSSQNDKDKEAVASFGFVRGYFEKPITKEHLETIMSTKAARAEA